MKLRQQIETATSHAISSGALVPLPTECREVEDDGIVFSVRMLGNLKAKKEAAGKREPGFDPFLPYDPDLFVADLSATHVCLLNKFNVFDHHVLMVTREFEEQESPLNPEDFEALFLCLREVDGLAFYNSGEPAGASQRHKHLQLAPLPVIPVESAMAGADMEASRIGRFPFRHIWTQNHLSSGRDLFHTYQAMLDALGLDRRQPRPYNLLVTRRWMMMVPRKREKWNGISINAFGFAGSLLVKNQPQVDAVIEHGAIKILQSVTFPDYRTREFTRSRSSRHTI